MITLVNSSRSISEFQFMSHIMSQISHTHSQEILDQYNLINQIEKLTRIDDNDGVYHVLGRLKTSLENSESSSTNTNQPTANTIRWVHNSIIYIILLVMSLAIGTWCIKHVKCPWKINYSKASKMETNLEIEMQELSNNTALLEEIITHIPPVIINHSVLSTDNELNLKKNLQDLKKQVHNEIQRFQQIQE